MLLHLLKPVFNVSKSVSSGDIVDQKCACCTSIELCRDTFKLFLTGGVVDLQFDVSLLPAEALPRILDLDHARTEIDPNRQVVLLAESFVGELHEQARFAHTCVTYDNVLEQE